MCGGGGGGGWEVLRGREWGTRILMLSGSENACRKHMGVQVLSVVGMFDIIRWDKQCKVCIFHGGGAAYCTWWTNTIQGNSTLRIVLVFGVAYFSTLQIEELGSSAVYQGKCSLRYIPEDSNHQDSQWRYWGLNEYCTVLSVNCVDKLLVSWHL